MGRRIRGHKHFMAPRARDDGRDPNGSVYEIGIDLWGNDAVNVSDFIIHARNIGSV